MKTIGMILVVVGFLALVYGGIDYSRNRTVLDMGSMSVTATENRSIALPGTVGVIALIGGGALLLLARRRPAL